MCSLIFVFDVAALLTWAGLNPAMSDGNDRVSNADFIFLRSAA